MFLSTASFFPPAAMARMSTSLCRAAFPRATLPNKMRVQRSSFADLEMSVAMA